MAKGFETWDLRVDAFKDKQWSNIFRGVSKLFKEGGDENRLFVNIKIASYVAAKNQKRK